jgi:predicted ATPase with chaperone activity
MNSFPATSVLRPHNTASDARLLGENVNPIPGEMSLAPWRFLDELPEFKRSLLGAPTA